MFSIMIQLSSIADLYKVEFLLRPEVMEPGSPILISIVIVSRPTFILSPGSCKITASSKNLKKTKRPRLGIESFLDRRPLQLKRIPPLNLRKISNSRLHKSLMRSKCYQFSHSTYFRRFSRKTFSFCGMSKKWRKILFEFS